MFKITVKYRQNSGIILLEVILLMAILGVIAVPASVFIYNFFSYNRTAAERILIDGQIRGILEEITKELRMAGFSDAGAYPIVSAEAQSLIFFSDVDNDGKNERIRYFLDGEFFKKGVVKSSGHPPVYNLDSENISVLANFVKNGSSSVFSYYDSNYIGSGAPLDFPVSVGAVRLIKVSLTIGVNVDRPEDFLNLSTNVALRNLKD